MNIKLYYTFTGIAPGNKGIITWRKSDESEEKGRLVANGVDVPFSGSFVIEGLLNATYAFDFYESSDGTELTTRLTDDPLLIDAGQSAESTVSINRYKIGDGTEETDPDKPYWATPNENDQTLIDERIAGATYDDLDVHIQGIGDLDDEQFTILDNGGITLTGDMVFYNGNFVKITYYTKKVTAAPVETITIRERILVVNAGNGASFTDEMYGKNLIGHFDTPNVGTTTFPNFSEIPDGTYAIFSTFQGPQRYWSLIFPFNTIPFMGANRGAIRLGQQEQIIMTWQSGQGYIVSYQGDYARVGRLITGHRQYVNTILSNGSPYDDSPAYVEFDKVDVPRLVEELPVEMTVDLVTWNTPSNVVLYKAGTTYKYYPHRAKFGVSEDKIRLPMAAGQVFEFTKPSDETNAFGSGPNTVGRNQLLEHTHQLMDGQGGNRTNPITGRGHAGMDTFNAFIPGDNLIDYTGGWKNKVDSIKQYLLVCI